MAYNHEPNENVEGRKPFEYGKENINEPSGNENKPNPLREAAEIISSSRGRIVDLLRIDKEGLEKPAAFEERLIRLSHGDARAKRRWLEVKYNELRALSLQDISLESLEAYAAIFEKYQLNPGRATAEHKDDIAQRIRTKGQVKPIEGVQNIGELLESFAQLTENPASNPGSFYPTFFRLRTEYMIGSKEDIPKGKRKRLREICFKGFEVQLKAGEAINLDKASLYLRIAEIINPDQMNSSPLPELYEVLTLVTTLEQMDDTRRTLAAPSLYTNEIRNIKAKLAVLGRNEKGLKE